MEVQARVRSPVEVAEILLALLERAIDDHSDAENSLEMAILPLYGCRFALAAPQAIGSRTLDRILGRVRNSRLSRDCYNALDSLSKDALDAHFEFPPR